MQLKLIYCYLNFEILGVSLGSRLFSLRIATCDIRAFKKYFKARGAFAFTIHQPIKFKKNSR